MTKLIEDFKAYLESAGWRYVPVVSQNAVVVVHQGNNGSVKAFIKDFDPTPVFMIQAECPVKVQPNRKQNIGELLHRINYGRLVGNMEFDWDEGTISYKVSVDYRGITCYNNDFFLRALAAAIGQLDNFTEDILAFTYGDEELLVENTVTIPGAIKVVPKKFNKN